MKKYILLISLFVGSFSQAAMDYGLEIGGRQQSGEVFGANFAANAQFGWQGGLFAHIPMDQATTHFRTGLLYTQRPLQSHNIITGDEIDYKLDYLDVPLQILFKPQEKFGLYFGMSAAINISKSCSGNPNCNIYDVDTPYFPFVFGAIFKFNPRLGMHFYFDGAGNEVAQGLGDYKAVGLNLMFSLD